MSPPSWWSGLKFDNPTMWEYNSHVSTLVVEWIEILRSIVYAICFRVSTLVVEWIEMLYLMKYAASLWSPPSWWSGLKSGDYRR